MRAFHLMACSVRPEFLSLYQWKDLVYVSQISSEMDPNIILSKFAGQIGPVNNLTVLTVLMESAL
jgi:hypothetical protein